jgi:hypothetical protein
MTLIALQSTIRTRSPVLGGEPKRRQGPPITGWLPSLQGPPIQLDPPGGLKVEDCGGLRCPPLGVQIATEQTVAAAGDY